MKSEDDRSRRLVELAALFTKLGVTSFGGPAGHIAMMEDEVVNRRRWLTRQHFLDLVSATNLIPGPNATEMAIHVGFIRAGWLGLTVAGVSFILPAVLITLAFAWFYVQFGSLPQVAPFLLGVKPAILSIILAALWRLGKAAIRSSRLLVILMAVSAAALVGIDQVAVLLLSGFLGMFWLRSPARGNVSDETAQSSSYAAATIPFSKTYWMVLVAAMGLVAFALIGSWLSATGDASLWSLGLFFLKIGSILYGSGYVLIVFLQADLVGRFGWLSEDKLLDAIAVGQFTPGPVLSTSTFVGYVILGIPGSIVSTAGIFLPSFFFVAALNPVVARLRHSPLASAFLDAINVGSVALIGVVFLRLSLTTLTGWPSMLVALAAFVVALRFKVNAAWLVLGGAVAGWLLSTLA